MENRIENLELETRIDQACDEENTRYALASVRLVRKSETDAILCASDGRIAACVKAHADKIADDVVIQNIPRDIIPRTKATRRNPRTVSLNGRWESRNKFTEAQRETELGRFPKMFGDVFPNASKDELAVRLDACLLHRLADSITSAGENKMITLVIRDDESAIAVIGANGIGVIMPLFCDKETHVANVARYNALRQELAETDLNAIEV